MQCRNLFETRSAQQDIRRLSLTRHERMSLGPIHYQIGIQYHYLNISLTTWFKACSSSIWQNLDSFYDGVDQQAFQMGTLGYES